ncbi:hypothetical protein [Aliarcobacter cryaerophilus]|uniref:hypothetical protein n=1 Tax=Aliarcobacter cryaerophilus TaxID=28198 RepID=UPI0021B42BD8|nr:hypothetical protein [Aliarcobacter cryaerophilus]MCT7512421.1 hypothetical protein [Aliarcobacter cryaerophilus]
MNYNLEEEQKNYNEKMEIVKEQIKKMTKKELQEENENLNSKYLILKSMNKEEQNENQNIKQKLKNIEKETENIYTIINEEFKKNNINRDLRDYIEKSLREIHFQIKQK